MSEKGMRLVAMIEQKEDGQYEVINFLPDIKIEHIQGKEFKVHEDDKHIKIPYAKGIDELTVIVGENGVGKTSLLNTLVTSTYAYLDIKLVFEKNGLYYINDNEYYPTDLSIINKFWKYINPKRVPIEVLNFSNSIESQTIYDKFLLSTMSKVEEYKDIDLLKMSDMSLQLKFLFNRNLNSLLINDLVKLSGKKIFFEIDSLPFESEEIIDYYPDDVLLDRWVDYIKQRKINSVEKIKEIIESYLLFVASFIKFDRELFKSDKFLETYLMVKNKTIFSNVFDNYDIAIEKIIERFCLNNLIINQGEGIIYEKILNDQHIEMLDKFLFDCVCAEVDFDEVSDYVAELDGFPENYIPFLTSIELLGKQNEILKIIKNEVSDFEPIDNLDKIFNFSGKYSDSLKVENYKERYLITIKNRKYHIDSLLDFELLLSELIKVKQNRKRFTMNLRDSSIDFSLINLLLDCIELSWEGLSSGEMALLNLFGRLHSVPQSIHDNVLLLLDEIDLGLHPEWQRKWMSTALPIIGEIFQGKHVQIIMTTHSPIMLSDIYQENVIFLGTDDNGERIVKENEELSATFGQNIHDLYRQSFFLESTRGQYATEKISNTISILNTLLKCQEDAYVKKVLFTEWIREQRKNCTDEVIDKFYLDYQNNRFNKENESLLKSFKEIHAEILSLENIDQKRRAIIDEEKQKFLDATQLPAEQLEQGLKKIIDSIGEDILRKTLLDMYHAIKEFQPKHRVKDLLSRYKITKEELRAYLDGDEKA